ncbi:MAG TPA: hypothetical protein VF529_13550 [Solirubrobacteraceae bacterium]|jgi:hypothetical protein
MRRWLVVPVVLLLVLAAPASAARVERRCDPLVPAIDCPVAPVTVVAAAGERNVIAISRDGSGVVVRDTGAPPTAGPGCEALAADAVRCAAAGAVPLTVAAGDGDDAIDARAAGAVLDVALDGGPGADAIAGTPARDVIDGGAGPDVLVGGDGNDFLTGDEGDAVAADTLDGGAGRDTAGYEERTRPLTVDLADPAPDGAPGEGDRLAGIEDVSSGSGDTVLRGDDGPNGLHAPFGNAGVVSRVTGRGGDDNLTGRVVDGGAGDDALSARVRARCGPGTDRMFDPRLLAPPPPRDCERIDLDGLIVDAKTIRVRGATIRLGVERTERGRGTILVRAGRRTIGRLRVPAAAAPRTVAVRLGRGARRGALAVVYDPAATGVPTRGFKVGGR